MPSNSVNKTQSRGSAAQPVGQDQDKSKMQQLTAANLAAFDATSNKSTETAKRNIILGQDQQVTPWKDLVKKDKLAAEIDAIVGEGGK